MAGHKRAANTAKSFDQTEELLGSRPAGESRLAVGGLIVLAGNVLRRNGLLAFGLSLLVGVVGLALLGIINCGGYVLPGALSQAWFDLGWAFFLLAICTIGAGYCYAVLQLLQQRRAGAKTLLAPFGSWRLLLNVAVAGAAIKLGPFLIEIVWAAIPWEYAGPVLDPKSPLAQAIGAVPGHEWLLLGLPAFVLKVVFFPLAWAGLDALIRRCSWQEALRHSAGLALRNKGLTMLLFAITMLVGQIYIIASPLVGLSPELSGLFTLASVFLGAVDRMLCTVLLVVLYREFVWREREAAVPTPTA